MPQRPPGIQILGVAASQDTQEDVALPMRCGIPAPFAELASHSAHAGSCEPGQSNGELKGAVGPQQLPLAAGQSSSAVELVMVASCAVDSLCALPVDSFSSQGKGRDSLRGCPVDLKGKAPQQKRLVWVDEIVYPTDSVVRQKEERKLREEKLAEDRSTLEGMKKLRKRKKLPQGEHFDDCGSDLGPLEETPLVNALALGGGVNSCIAYSFLDADAFGSSSAKSSEGGMERVLNDNFDFHVLLGCDGFHHHVDPPTSVRAELSTLCPCHAEPENGTSRMNVCELFGGGGGVGKLCIPRRPRCGRNFDIVIGVDLTNEADQREALRYLDAYKFLVVVMGPPCAGFGHWSHLSRYIHPEIWGKTREVGECLAAFAAKVCKVQLVGGRHFLLAAPPGRSCSISIASDRCGTLASSGR